VIHSEMFGAHLSIPMSLGAKHEQSVGEQFSLRSESTFYLSSSPASSSESIIDDGDSFSIVTSDTAEVEDGPPDMEGGAHATPPQTAPPTSPGDSSPQPKPQQRQDRETEIHSHDDAIEHGVQFTTVPEHLKAQQSDPEPQQNASTSTNDQQTRPRRQTNPYEFQDTILHPPAVRINVAGAFIVDPENSSHAPSPSGSRRSSDVPADETLAELENDIIEHHEAKDIRLPNHTSVVSHIAVDIGGSLAKLVYFSREPGEQLGGRLNFAKFETDRVDSCIAFMKRLKNEYVRENGKRTSLGNEEGDVTEGGEDLYVLATGGGAFKYYDRIREALGVEVVREDEMECLIIGMSNSLAICFVIISMFSAPTDRCK
jgi:hypothetical protein